MKTAPTGSQGAALLGDVLVGVSVSLGVGNLKSGPVAHFLPPADPDVELAASSTALCLPARRHAPHHADNGLTSEL